MASRKEPDWSKLSEVLATDAYRDIDPPGPIVEERNLPEISVDTRWAGRPEVSGSVAAPVAGGEGYVSGSYYKPDPYIQPRVDARMGWKKRF